MHNSPRQSRDLHEDDAMTNVVRMPTLPLVSCDKDGGQRDLRFLASRVDCTRGVRGESPAGLLFGVSMPGLHKFCQWPARESDERGKFNCDKHIHITTEWLIFSRLVTSSI